MNAVNKSHWECCRGKPHTSCISMTYLYQAAQATVDALEWLGLGFAKTYRYQSEQVLAAVRGER